MTRASARCSTRTGPQLHGRPVIPLSPPQYPSQHPSQMWLPHRHLPQHRPPHPAHGTCPQSKQPRLQAVQPWPNPSRLPAGTRPSSPFTEASNPKILPAPSQVYAAPRAHRASRSFSLQSEATPSRLKADASTSALSAQHVTRASSLPRMAASPSLPTTRQRRPFGRLLAATSASPSRPPYSGAA